MHCFKRTLHIFDTSPLARKRQYAYENEHILPTSAHIVYSSIVAYGNEYINYSMGVSMVVSVSVTSYPGTDGKLFDYHVLAGQHVVVGSIVKIPFGPKTTLGVVMSAPHQASRTEGKQRKLFDIIEPLDDVVLPHYILSLATWLMEYYVASPSAAWRTILPSGLAQKVRLKDNGISQSANPKSTQVTLNQEQINAVENISTSKLRGHLLHGITGSGKTEVYIELIKRSLSQGLSAIVLVPEIALTPQMTERLRAHFTNDLIVSHSKFTPAHRKRIWLEALRDNNPKVYLGPRSALFLPVKQPGIIIVDEEHEASYKQENAPTYHASSVAAKLSDLTQARYVLGSATPLLYSRYLAERGKIGYVELTERAAGAKLPVAQIIALQKSQLLSPELVNGLKNTLRDGKQAILFLNRRGSASAMLCDNCGHIEKCPRCDTSLTFHADTARLTCHYCTFAVLPPTSCPECKHTDMHFVGTGTKALEQEIHRLFGKYTIRRLDSDNASLEYIEQLYRELRDGQIDIVIGTQMIARGLDLPNVTMVGVVLAESMLAIPDFSANERTFELITQVAGRAGRAQTTGHVVIQTHSTKHPAIVAASRHDFQNFYTWESANRKAHAYPPYSYLLKLVYGHRDAQKAEAASLKLIQTLRNKYTSIIVLGPTDRAVKRVAGKHQKQVIVKSLNRTALVTIARGLSPGWKHDLDPINLM